MRLDLFDAIKKGEGATVDELLDRDAALVNARNEDGLSPLLVAMYWGRGDIASSILRRNPDLNVFEAAAAGETERVRELVAADRSQATALSIDGYTALGLAAFFKHRDVVRDLLAAGAEARAASRQGGFTPLHSAVATDAGARDIEIVRMLLDAGADPNAKAQSGSTALHTVAFTGDREVAELLLTHGADPSLRNNDGKTASDVARDRGNEEIANVLAA
jgi:uncharacterized protein